MRQRWQNRKHCFCRLWLAVDCKAGVFLNFSSSLISTSFFHFFSFPFCLFAFLSLPPTVPLALVLTTNVILKVSLLFYRGIPECPLVVFCIDVPIVSLSSFALPPLDLARHLKFVFSTTTNTRLMLSRFVFRQPVPQRYARWQLPEQQPQQLHPQRNMQHSKRSYDCRQGLCRQAVMHFYRVQR